MKPTPKTIQLFLPTGKPRGLKIAQVTSRIPIAIYVPRSDLKEAYTRLELSRSGIYFLFGDSDDARTPVYVGESEDCLDRLKQHHNSDKEWNTAIVIVSKTDELTKCQIRFLEWFCCNEIEQIGQGRLTNRLSPSEPFVSESVRADLLEMFETISLLLSTLDFPIFERLTTELKQRHVCCKSGKANAKGEKVADGFVVFKGSLACLTTTDSARSTLKSTREQLKAMGILEQQGDQLIFMSDYLFPSPSQAAGIILGRSANGWTDWKNEEGKTLHEIIRKDSDESTQK